MRKNCDPSPFPNSSSFPQLDLRDQSGQSVLEYVLLLSIVVFFASTIARSLMGNVDRGVLMMGGQLEHQLKTGRVDDGIWKN